MLRLRSAGLGWPVEELWVSGELLAPVEEIGSVSVVVMLDLPADELPWLAVHPVGEWVGEQLRLGKRPVDWCYRPMVWPAWTYRQPLVVRFWSAREGVDQVVIELLGSGTAVVVVEPEPSEFAEQLGVELAAARAHLAAVLDRYWDQDWRRSSRGATTPEDQLWRAATALVELERALSEQGS